LCLQYPVFRVHPALTFPFISIPEAEQWKIEASVPETISLSLLVL
jgi:hypothetical protein